MPSPDKDAVWHVEHKQFFAATNVVKMCCLIMQLQSCIHNIQVSTFGVDRGAFCTLCIWQNKAETVLQVQLLPPCRQDQADVKPVHCMSHLMEPSRPQLMYLSMPGVQQIFVTSSLW